MTRHGTQTFSTKNQINWRTEKFATPGLPPPDWKQNDQQKVGFRILKQIFKYEILNLSMDHGINEKGRLRLEIINIAHRRTRISQMYVNCAGLRILFRKSMTQLQDHASTWEMNGDNLFFTFSNFPKPSSTTDGKLSNRRVWPVGAVSKTTTSKFIPFTSLSVETSGMWRKNKVHKEN